MKALVTGGAGFVGSHIVERLLERGEDVRVLDNLATGRRENLRDAEGHVEMIQGDIRELDDARAAVKGCEVILHLAAVPSVPRSVREPELSVTSSAAGTFNVLLAARDAGVRRVVYSSSSSVYGPRVALPLREDAAPAPISPYAAAKLAGESYCRAFCETYGLETLSLRYFNVFGPRQNPASQYAAVIPAFVAAARAGRQPVIYGDGEQSRDFTFVDNAVHATLLAVHAAAARGEAINVACSEQTSISRLWELISAATGASLEPRHEPGRASELRHSVADVARAARLLDYRPIVRVEDGIARLLAAVDRPSASDPRAGVPARTAPL